MKTIERADGTICHIDEHIIAKCVAEHDLSAEQVEEAILGCSNPDNSRSSGDPMLYGHIGDGRQVCVVLARVLESEDEFSVKTVYPVKKSEAMLSEKVKRRKRFARRKQEPKRHRRRL